MTERGISAHIDCSISPWDLGNMAKDLPEEAVAVVMLLVLFYEVLLKKKKTKAVSGY